MARRYATFQFRPVLRGGHVHVSVRAGTYLSRERADEAFRPKAGDLVFSEAEWSLLRQVLARGIAGNLVATTDEDGVTTLDEGTFDLVLLDDGEGDGSETGVASPDEEG